NCHAIEEISSCYLDRHCHLLDIYMSIDMLYDLHPHVNAEGCPCPETGTDDRLSETMLDSG
ncbi:MAG: hypothetical protein CMP96_01025, partial [Gammaproteobacteria bacterium]|nr:hypothetical protein [Gammaproteobacteria bacterium]